MEWPIGIVCGVVLLALLATVVNRSVRAALAAKIEDLKLDLAEIAEQSFMVQPCARCHEFAMRLLEVSPNGRSIQYQCIHCKKKMHAPAGTADAVEATTLWHDLTAMAANYRKKGGHIQTSESPAGISVEVTFVAPAAPLPYEQTTRTPIPEAVRGEVWRRDGGKCVDCGSNQNLQFDHIIPVARGGATSAVNLQLLCQRCNGSKGARI